MIPRGRKRPLPAQAGTQGWKTRAEDLRAARATANDLNHSHSIVPGGLEVTSYTTRFTPFTSFTIREEIVFRTSWGRATQSAVMPSSELTALIAHVWA